MGIVNPNPSQFRFLDVGAALKAGSDISYGRLRNEALGMEVEEAQDMLANRKKADEIRAQYDKMPDQINALNAAGMQDRANELKDEYVKSMSAQMDMMEKIRPALNAENYDQVRQELIQTGAITGELWPVKYSDSWFRDQIAGARSNLQKHVEKWTEDGMVMSQDIFSRGGVVDPDLGGQPYSLKSDQPTDGPGGGDNWKGWTATDSNTLAREAERMFGTYDPVSGSYAILDRDMKQQVQSLQTEAEAIYVRGRNAGNPEMTHALALTQAARKMHIKVPDLAEEFAENPLNLTRPEQ
jgi:hypothetical protein